MENYHYYWCLIGTSRYAASGVRWGVMLHSEQNIIDLAGAECSRVGTTLEDEAGIKWVGAGEPDEDGEYSEFKPERDWAEGEEFLAAVEKLSDDGREFLPYLTSSNKEVAEFLEDARERGVYDAAIKLVDHA